MKISLVLIAAPSQLWPSHRSAHCLHSLCRSRCNHNQGDRVATRGLKYYWRMNMTKNERCGQGNNSSLVILKVWKRHFFNRTIVNDRSLETKEARRNYDAQKLSRYYIVFREWIWRLLVHTQYALPIFRFLHHLFRFKLSGIGNIFYPETFIRRKRLQMIADDRFETN